VIKIIESASFNEPLLNNVDKTDKHEKTKRAKKNTVKK
jgi:hypothetical protein